jgi:hypothetical protein
MSREELRKQILDIFGAMTHLTPFHQRIVKAQQRFWAVRHEQELDEMLLDDVLNEQDGLLK